MRRTSVYAPEQAGFDLGAAIGMAHHHLGRRFAGNVFGGQEDPNDAADQSERQICKPELDREASASVAGTSISAKALIMRASRTPQPAIEIGMNVSRLTSGRIAKQEYRSINGLSSRASKNALMITVILVPSPIAANSSKPSFVGRTARSAV